MIETLVVSICGDGFLMMVLSLYINYRLKSVAHMPSKALTYTLLSTSTCIESRVRSLAKAEAVNVLESHERRKLVR